MQEQQIILDEKSFKALSADSRVNILKSLKERRMTLSELSKKLALEGSTIKEHCSILMNAELIKLIDDGHKWKYYELTGKGKNIVTPNLFEQVKVLIVLCLGAVIFSGILFGLFSSMTSIGGAQYNSQVQDSQVMKSTGISEPTILATTPLTENQENRAVSDQEITREFFVLTTTLALLAGLIIGFIGARKTI